MIILSVCTSTIFRLWILLKTQRYLFQNSHFHWLKCFWKCRRKIFCHGCLVNLYILVLYRGQCVNDVEELSLHSWITNYIHYTLWNEITCWVPNFNSGAFHPTFYWSCDYLSMLGLSLIHYSNFYVYNSITISLGEIMLTKPTKPGWAILFKWLKPHNKRQMYANRKICSCDHSLHLTGISSNPLFGCKT